MPSRTATSTANNGFGYVYNKDELYYSWNRSPKVNGELVLVANAMSRTEKKVQTLVLRRPPNGTRTAVWGASRIVSSPVNFRPSLETAANNQAYSALMRKIRGEEAAFGMTLSTWRQSWDMIGLRAKQIMGYVTKAKRAAARDERRARKKPRGRGPNGLRSRWRKAIVPKGSADYFLEYQFGWLPLLSDIFALARVLCDDFPREIVRGTGRSSDVWQLPKDIGGVKTSGNILWDVRVVQSCFVRVDNPNVWLLNKLGLINPGVVLWDRVPWSFVVNEFINLNSIMASFTDTAGLEITQASVTRKWRTIEVSDLTVGDGKSTDSATETRVFVDTVKNRQLGLALPSLQFKLPTLNMTGALIKVSLVTQQVSGLRSTKNWLNGN